MFRRISAISTLIIVLLTALICWYKFRSKYEYDFEFAFYLFLILPLLGIWYIWKDSKLEAVVETGSFEQFAPSSGSAEWIRHLPYILRNFALIAGIMVLARPQSKTSYENLTKEGIDIVLSMDVSGSMLSMDFDPNRLEVSKAVARDFIAGRPDDRVAIVSYEGESFTQVPLTTDHRVISSAIAGLNTGQLESGTAIGMGLATAVSRLKDSEAKSKVIILLTDGVNNAGQVKPLDAAQIAKAFGIRVYTIGVGTTGKAKSPVRILPDGSYLFDWVEVKIDEEILTQIADYTGGQYFRATSVGKLRDIYTEIDQMEKTRFNVTQFNQKTEEYGMFAFASIILLLAEFLIRNLFLRSVT